MAAAAGDQQPDDLIIIGAGLAGVSAARAASRQGYAVSLIDAHEHYPPDFRGEKLGEQQMALFDRIGLGHAARAQLTRFDGVWRYRQGRLLHRQPGTEYASDYAGLVNALRAALPERLARITGRVQSIATGPGLQRVTMADGRVREARLLVVATGLGDAVRRMLGIERRIRSKAHSLSIGFDLAAPARGFAFPSLVWGREADPALSYLTLFPIGATMRANLFVYHGLADAWTSAFRADPLTTLHRTMPALSALGRMDIAGKPVLRPIDIVEAVAPERPGVVLVGDAFSVVCPITGMGMAKALNDIDLLCHRHLPGWLATPGMGLDKIARFYADPDKQALDHIAVRDSLVGRNLAMATSSYWRLRRLGSTLAAGLRDKPLFAPPHLPAPGPVGARERLADFEQIG